MTKTFCLVATAALALVGCKPGVKEDIRIETAADLVGRSGGVQVGSMMADMTDKIQAGIKWEWFNDFNSCIEALRLGKLDGVPLDFFFARRWAEKEPDAFATTQPYGSIPWGFLFAKNSTMKARVNDILAQMTASGELKRIIERWYQTTDPSALPLERLDYKKDFTGKAGTFRFATPADREPVCFPRKDGYGGFDYEIVRRIAYELDMKLELVPTTMGAIVPAVQSGKVDMGGGGIAITKERAEKVDFSPCYFRAPSVFLIRRSSAAGIKLILSPADLKGKRIAHMSSDFHKRELVALQPEITFAPYSEYAFAVESLRSGKIDAISLGRTYAELWLSKFPGEFRIAFDYAKDGCSFLLPKGSPLKSRIDAEIRKMNENGESVRIIRKWFEAAKAGKTMKLPEFAPPPANAQEVRVACAAQAEPWCFVSAEKVMGVDIEILMTVAQRLGLKLKPKIYSWGGMVDAVNGNRTDIASGGIYTGGNTFPTVDATVKYADESMCLLVRDKTRERGDRAGGRSKNVSFLSSLKQSFIRTFVTEDRWKMLAKGLGITLLVTFLAAVLGTVLAFPVWLARTSSVGFVTTLARWYISILQGTPVLVLLMVLFYIVFGSVDIDGIWVAVIGFGLNGSAYIGETLRSGIDSVPVGQTEAALALGYTPRQAFFRFVLPQAVRAIMPVYRGELISILKSTSIVGYIAINDLTKASDLVRSRTYESFFPILTTAFIYFVVAWLLAKFLDRIGRRNCK